MSAPTMTTPAPSRKPSSLASRLKRTELQDRPSPSTRYSWTIVKDEL